MDFNTLLKQLEESESDTNNSPAFSRHYQNSSNDDLKYLYSSGENKIKNKKFKKEEKTIIKTNKKCDNGKNILNENFCISKPKFIEEINLFPKNEEKIEKSSIMNKKLNLLQSNQDSSCASLSSLSNNASAVAAFSSGYSSFLQSDNVASPFEKSASEKTFAINNTASTSYNFRPRSSSTTERLLKSVSHSNIQYSDIYSSEEEFQNNSNESLYVEESDKNNNKDSNAYVLEETLSNSSIMSKKSCDSVYSLNNSDQDFQKKNKIRRKSPSYNGRISNECRFKSKQFYGISTVDIMKVAGVKTFLDTFVQDKKNTRLSGLFKLTILRQFFRFCIINEYFPIDFHLLYKVKVVEHFIKFICAAKTASTKAKLNKLYGVKFLLNWLHNRASFKEPKFIEKEDKEVLRSLEYFVSNMCKSLTPHAKCEDKCATTKIFYEKRNQYLSPEEFRNLGVKLLKNMNKIHASLKKSKNLAKETRIILLYQKLLFTSLFVLIPVQRLSTIVFLKNKDIHFDKKANLVSIHIGVEKNSYRMYSAEDKIGRFLFVPSFLAFHLYNWFHVYQCFIKTKTPNGNKNLKDYSLFYQSTGEAMSTYTGSKYIRETTQRLIKKIIGPVVLRKLRITHTLSLIHSSDISTFDKNLFETQLAMYGGHTVEIMNDYYKIRDQKELVKANEQHTRTSNQLLFGEEMSKEQKFYAEDDADADTKDSSYGNGKQHEKIVKCEIKSPKKLNKSKNTNALLCSKVQEIDKQSNSKNIQIIKLEHNAFKTYCTINHHVCSKIIKVKNTNDQCLININEKELMEISTPGIWLNDRHIYYALFIIKNQFMYINGLEDTLLLEHQQVKTVADKKENYYVLFDGKNHWIAAATYCYSNYWYIYDCMNICNTEISQSIKKQLNFISGRQRDFQVMKCTKQQGTSDCGLFSIAYIVDLIYKKRPETLIYDQTVMRKHFIECVNKQLFTPFPSKERVTYIDMTI